MMVNLSKWEPICEEAQVTKRNLTRRIIVKYYVQLLTTQKCKWDKEKMKLVDLEEPLIVESMGSDGVLILDGRESLLTHMMDGEEYRAKIKRVHPDICGFRIMKGTSFVEINEVIYECIDKRNSLKKSKLPG